MGGDGWDSADLDKAAAAGGFYTNHYSPDDPRPRCRTSSRRTAPSTRTTRQRQVPDALATLAYDATNLMLNTIKTAGAMTRPR